MNNYLPTATNFQDIEIQQKAHSYIKKYRLKKCPLCKGHGKWNLILNAYGEGKHFQASCSQCNGWGWVDRKSIDATCIHEFKPASQKAIKEARLQLFYGDHPYQCKKCKKMIVQCSK